MQGISSDYFRMTIKKETLFVFLIIVFLMGYDTILIEPYQVAGFLTKILVVAGFFLLFRLNKISGSAVTIIFLFSILLLYGLFIAILNNNFTLSLGLTLKFAWRIFAFTSLLMILQADSFSENIIKIRPLNNSSTKTANYYKTGISRNKKDIFLI